MIALSDSDIMALAEEARRAIVAQPAGFLVDPGAGSAMDKFQRQEPGMTQLADMVQRGGAYETLYTGTSVEKMILHVVRAVERALCLDDDSTPTPPEPLS